jgi:phosphoglycolate phosphatase
LIRSKTRLLITDLDNTLYDWVRFFALSFTAMAQSLAEQLGLSLENVLDQFKKVHSDYQHTELPFAALELEAVRERFPGVSPRVIATALKRPLDAFEQVRRHTLELYPTVRETLEYLHGQGIMLAGHTEAIPENAIPRLRRLGVLPYFTRVYCLDWKIPPHPHGEYRRGEYLAGGVRLIAAAERKPNPDAVRRICREFDVSVEEAAYVGDSIRNDVFMANEAGTRAVWARYGTQHVPEHWDTLLSITHWAPGSAELSAARGEPEVIIDEFRGVLDLFRS